MLRTASWQNLAKAVEKVAPHRSCLPEPVIRGPTAEKPGSEQEPDPPVPRIPSAAVEPSGTFAERARRHHAKVRELLAEGYAIRAIVRHLGWGRHTVQRYARSETGRNWSTDAGMPARQHAGPVQAPPALALGGGLHQLRRAVPPDPRVGYTGSYSTVRDHLAEHRPAKAPLVPPPLTVHEVTGWLTRHPDSLTEDERPQLKAVLDRCPELAAASEYVRAFATMLTQLSGHLPQWISDAHAPAAVSPPLPKASNRTSTPSPLG